jgi:hypothetical protein
MPRPPHSPRFDLPLITQHITVTNFSRIMPYAKEQPFVLRPVRNTHGVSLSPQTVDLGYLTKLGRM